jgi:hypothetical protein
MNTNYWQNATPQQNILWHTVKALFGANYTVTELQADGSLVGTEFYTYNAKKIYVALSMQLHYYTYLPGNSGWITFYDQANVEKMRATNESLCYDPTYPSVLYMLNPLHLENFWFTRCISAYQDYIFVGYRVTWP